MVSFFHLQIHQLPGIYLRVIFISSFPTIFILKTSNHFESCHERWRSSVNIIYELFLPVYGNSPNSLLNLGLEPRSQDWKSPTLTTRPDFWLTLVNHLITNQNRYRYMGPGKLYCNFIFWKVLFKKVSKLYSNNMKVNFDKYFLKKNLK